MKPIGKIEGLGKIEGVVEGLGKIEALGEIKKGKPNRNEYLRLNGLGPLPPNTKKTDPQTMRDYYDDFSQAFAIDANESLYSNKGGMYKDMVQKLDDLINLSIE